MFSEDTPEFNPGPFGSDPRHFSRSYDRRSSVVRVHYEERTLTRLSLIGPPETAYHTRR